MTPSAEKLVWPRTLSVAETWGFGFTGLLLWLLLAADGRGTPPLAVWLPVTIVGITINLQVKYLGSLWPDVLGGTPNYVTRLFSDRPWAARYAAMAYFLRWAAVPALSAMALSSQLNALGPAAPAIAILLAGVSFVLAFGGSRVLSVPHLFFIVPVVGLLLALAARGLVLNPRSAGLPDPVSLAGWAQWYLLAACAAYSAETAASFVADSTQPKRTLRCLAVVGWLLPVVFAGGRDLPAAVVAAGCLLTCTAAAAVAPRMLCQLARDGHAAPVLGVCTRQMVPGPALLVAAFIAVCLLATGGFRRLLAVTAVSWMIPFIALHAGLWRQRGTPDTRWPRWSLALALLEAVVLVVGGLSWGWIELLAGLLAPAALMGLDSVVRRFPWKPAQPEWWRQRYQRQARPSVGVLRVSAALFFLLAGSLTAGFLLGSTSNRQGALLLAALFLGVALACRIIVPPLSSILDYQKEVETTRKDAVAAVDAKSDFLANMSHEIRTPLNAVLGMTGLALETPLTRQQREYLDLVKSGAEALMSVINDILDFSKIEAGKLELDRVDFNLREIVETSVRTLVLRAEAKNVELAWNIDKGVPAWVHGDPHRLQQILFNLVGNSVKFTAVGEVVVRVRVQECSPRELVLQVSVSDTGIGIAPEKQQRIFQPFHQADTSTTRQYGGTGLGLSICKHLVELMGGRMWVQSVPGQGSTFHFTARLGVVKMAKTSTIPRAAVDMRDLAVLVVDDNATNLRILQGLLAGWKMRPTTAANGSEALAALRAGRSAGQPFPLVLLDAQMPGMDGVEVAGQIRQDPHLARTRIVLLISASRSGDRERGREVGVNSCLTKPVGPYELLEAIRCAFGAGASQGEASEPEARAGAGPLRILLAEDNPLNQKLMRYMLGNWGHTLKVAADGTEAVRMWAQGQFDIVLMDVQMPVMDGLRATAAIRERERQRGSGHIPIIAMTARALSGDREKCLEAGMDGYVAKPVRAELLEAEIFRLAPKGAPTLKLIPAPEAVESAAPDGLLPLLERLRGDRTMAAEMASDFLSNWPEVLVEVEAAVAARDPERVELAAHRLAGQMGYFLPEGQECRARQLETLARQGDLNGAPELYRDLKDELEKLSGVLGQLAQEVTSESPDRR